MAYVVGILVTPSAAGQVESKRKSFPSSQAVLPGGTF